MQAFWITLAVIGGIALIVLVISFICYRMAFYNPPRKNVEQLVIEIPIVKGSEAFREQMEEWARESRKLPFEEMYITAYDGTPLYGRYYERYPNAPIELMVHGYRGKAERDLPGAIQRCFAVGRNVLVIDLRACGKSGGNTVTFGIKEYRDCLSWVEHMIKRFGNDVKIVLTGISMGASTVLLCADKDLPKNVIGILADCGYTSAKEIIKVVIKQMKLPADIAYPFVRLGAIIFGRFDPDETSSIEAVKNAKVPVIFYHGEIDDFVPCDMSVANYNACGASKKKLVTVPNAGHGLSYPVAQEYYLKELREFFGPEGSYQE